MGTYFEKSVASVSMGTYICGVLVFDGYLYSREYGSYQKKRSNIHLLFSDSRAHLLFSKRCMLALAIYLSLVLHDIMQPTDSWPLQNEQPMHILI